MIDEDIQDEIFDEWVRTGRRVNSVSVIGRTSGFVKALAGVGDTELAEEYLDKAKAVLDRIQGFTRMPQHMKSLGKSLYENGQAALWDEVKDRLHDSALALSGGQQQRLCIARALATDPDVLLMDEPASALDPASTSKIEDLIFELKENYTIVIVTHNMQQAARISDRTAFFYEGRLIEMEKTKELFTKPRQKHTEDYITGRFG